jgi:hypothetical protein
VGVNVQVSDLESLTPGWVRRIVRAIRPREGFLSLGLTWAALICLPAAAIEGGLVTGLQPSLWLTTLGMLTAWWLAHRRPRGLIAAPILIAAGFVADLLWGVHVWAFWPLLPQATRWVGWAASCGLQPHCAVAAPAVPYWGDQAASLMGFAERVGWWFAGLSSGQGVPDNLVLIGVAGLLSWLVGTWTGWWVPRHGKPFVALFPAGILMLQTIFSTDTGNGWILVYLGSLAMLLAMTRFDWDARAWEAHGIDYSTELRLELGLVAGLAVTLALILSPVLPFLTSPDFSQLFWGQFEKPYTNIEQTVNRSLPGVQGKRSLMPPTRAAIPGLPRSHLLGGRPDLAQKVALRVQVRGNHPGDVLRWRGQTFAVYNGRGWLNDSPQGPGQYVSRNLPAGQPWLDAQPAARHPVLSSIQIYDASRGVLYSPEEPVSVDQPYTALTRDPGELTALQAPGLPAGYTVLAAVPDMDAPSLRGAGTDYPDSIRRLYLDLPDSVPSQVYDMAKRLTANTTNPYDAALAIEKSLRALPYTLDVPAPPEGVEVSSWFLFDLQKGYCDYFATAMAVLARADGIPSRLAVGYATGDFDTRTQTYVVKELQAHSWPELYFPNFGWIPFEPTPSEPAPVRQNADQPAYAGMPTPPGMTSVEGQLNELRQLAQQRSIENDRLGWLQRVLGTLNALLTLWTAWRWLRTDRTDPLEGPAAWYDEMARWGKRLGRPPRPAETPREYAAALVAAASVAADAGNNHQGGATRAAAVVETQVPALTTAFELSRFAPPQEMPVLTPDHRKRAAAEEKRRWHSLWAALRRLWVAMRLRV